MDNVKNLSESHATYHLSKNPKNWFVSFDDLEAMIAFHELSPLASIITAYMEKIRNLKIASTFSGPATADNIARTLRARTDDMMIPYMDPRRTICTYSEETFGERYYLPYPWYQCFAGSIISYSDDSDIANEWARENGEDIDDETELPLTKMWGYTFSNYFGSRLSDLLTSSISPSQYEKWINPNYHIVLNSERRAFVAVNGKFEIVQFGHFGNIENVNIFDKVERLLGCNSKVFLIGNIDYSPIASEFNNYSKEVLQLIDRGSIIVAPHIIKMLQNGAQAIGLGETQEIESCDIESVRMSLIDERVKAQLNVSYQRFITPFPWVEY